MLVMKAQTKSLTARNSTVDGVLVTVYLEAAATNTAITPATFVRNEVTLKSELKRNRSVHQVCQDNMEVLGLYSAKNYGIRDWQQGNKMTIAAVGVAENMILNVFVRYGGCINLKGDDQLVTQCKVGTSAFGAAYSQANSFVQFDYNNAVGYEEGVPQIMSQVVQANITQEKYYPGNHVSKVMLLNLDKDNITAQVITTLAISSDRFDMSMNFYAVMNRDRNVLLPPRMEERFTTTAYDPATLIFGYQQQFPQTWCLFATEKGEETLNNVIIDCSYNGAQVAASKNYMVWTSFLVSKNSVARGIRRAAKHNLENYNSLPGSIPVADGGDVGGAPADISIESVKVK